MKDVLKNICNKVLSIYNNYFGVIDGVLCLILFANIENKVIKFAFLGLGIYSAWRWYKNYFKNLEYKNRVHSKVLGNSTIAIYGGIRTGKSTLARKLINEFVPKDKQYFNFKCKGYKALTWRHLILADRLEDKCGVMVDECGRQYDSFKYSKRDDDVRSRLVTLNKFFGQYYGTGSLLIYVDQSEDNVNTALYRSVYYVIQCHGTRVMHTGLLFWGIAELYRMFKQIPKDKWVNPFSLVSIEFVDFTKTGDYAKNYSINIDADKCFYYVDSVQEMFGYHDTNVFKEYNPAKVVEPYIWGTSEYKDNKIMEQNFSLKELKKDIDTNGIDISKVEE